MNFTILSFVLLFCSLTLARDDGNANEIEIKGESQSHVVNRYLLREFGAMTDKLGAMETRMKDCEKELLELRNKERTKVIFSAATANGTGAIGPFNTDTTLIYSSMITNIGNAYSQSTGVFAAPVAGVYYFSIFYHAGGEHESVLLLYKNNEMIVKAHDHQSDSDTADNGGNAVFLQLQQGDKVYVRLGANTHVWGSLRHTTFNGFLVTQM